MSTEVQLVNLLTVPPSDTTNSHSTCSYFDHGNYIWSSEMHNGKSKNTKEK